MPGNVLEEIIKDVSGQFQGLCKKKILFGFKYVAKNGLKLQKLLQVLNF
jgi:hypothetical protein